jgi:hypothetical protein
MLDVAGAGDDCGLAAKRSCLLLLLLAQLQRGLAAASFGKIKDPSAKQSSSARLPALLLLVPLAGLPASCCQSMEVAAGSPLQADA